MTNFLSSPTATQLPSRKACWLTSSSIRQLNQDTRPDDSLSELTQNFLIDSLQRLNTQHRQAVLTRPK